MPKDELKSLSLKKIKSIHVTHNDQKIIALAVVLKDTAGNNKFWENQGILNRFVITDVQIKPDNSSKVDLILRNVNVKEVIDLARNGIISGQALHASLGDTIETLIQSSDSEAFMDLVEKEAQAEKINLEDFWNNIGPVTDVLLANIRTIPEVEDQQLYKLTIPLVDAHLAQALYAKTNSPSFVLVDEVSFKEMEEAEKAEEPMLLNDFAMLDYPLLGSSEYYSAIAGLIHKVEGYYPLNVSPNRARELRGEVLSLVVNLANGSSDALVRAFGYLNPVKTGLNAYVKRKATGTSHFTQDHVDMVYFAECIERIYEYLSPSAIAAIIQQKEDNNDYYQAASLVDDLFADSELADSFNEILGETFGKFLDHSSTVEDIIEFYSASLWEDAPGFPENMTPLIPKINLPVLSENNFMKSSQNVEETATNSGSLAIAKLIAAAARYNRLIEITQQTNVSLNPIGCLVQGLTYPDELEIWVVVESVRRLHLPGGLKMFMDIYTSGLTNPHLDSKYSSKYNLVESGLTNVLHRLGHTLLEEFSLEDALSLMPSNESLSHYVDALYNPSEVPGVSDEEESDEEGSMCPPLEATFAIYDDIDFKYEGDDYVESIGKFILALADYKAEEMFGSTTTTRKDSSWQSFVDRWLVLLITPFPNN